MHVRSACAHKLLGNLHGIEGDGDIEVTKRNDKNEEQDGVNEPVGIEYLVEATPEARTPLFQDRKLLPGSLSEKQGPPLR